MTYECILTETRGDGERRIGLVTLNRPKQLNALNDTLMDELGAALLAFDADPGIGCIVLTGSEKAFAAGADIAMMQPYGFVDAYSKGLISRNWETIRQVRKPVIAAVAGFALGGGCELALTADFRICGDNAKLGQPEILLGIIPGAGGTQRLPRLIGAARAKDIVYSGRFVGAEEALAIGLVDRVVAPDDVYSAAVEMVSRYVNGPALALRAAKAAIDGGLDGDLASGLRLETQLFTGLFATEDRVIGMTSFVENGPGKAQFVGR